MVFNPFLRQIAARYSHLSIGELSNYCFVFPNRRSGFFFKEYFRQTFKATRREALVTPLITTMSALAENWSKRVVARHSELLLLLFRTYIDLLQNRREELPPTLSHALEPDRFIFWCDIILNDFNDVDMALAPAWHLYRNLKDLKTLQTNPLDEDQFKELQRFWSVAKTPWIQEPGNQRMWIYQDNASETDGIRNFVKLWAVLGPLYDAFGEALEKEGLGYQGLAYRKAVEELGQILDDEKVLEKKKYVFVGFSYLSNAEREIMRLLKKHGYAEFYWDNSLPQIDIPDNFPLKLIERYMASFPMPDDFTLEITARAPAINIYSVPSETGQVEQVARILKEDESLSAGNALEYAVVLPETQLCVPLLHSMDLSPDISTNISLGFPVKDTPIASLMNAITQMRSLARKVKGKWQMNRRHIMGVMTQPMLMQRCGNDCLAVIAAVRNKKGLYVDADVAVEASPLLSFLFEGFDENSLKLSLKVFLNIVNTLAGILSPLGSDTSNSFNLLDSYKEEAAELLYLLDKYNLDEYFAASGEAVFTIIEKIIRRLTLSFAGTPLKGIQIMGVLETRALDFKTLIMTSMNERSFPRKLEKPSFIPQSLRAVYGLEDSEDQETVMAYHFYRLISRASNVHLLYNSDTEGLKSGEVSRYIYQLKYLDKCPALKEIILKYEPGVQHKGAIKVNKDDNIMRRINSFLAGNGNEGAKALSASSIKKYLTCELAFFLDVICGMGEEDEDNIHIDDILYGNIIHKVMELILKQQPKGTWKGKAYNKVTVKSIDDILAGNIIDRCTEQAIKQYYYGDEKSSEELNGEAQVFKLMVMRSIKELLRAEKETMLAKRIGYYLYIGGESKKNTVLDFDGLKLRFTYTIDRVDRVFPESDFKDSHLRIIDYKTGSDSLSFKGVDSLVEYSNQSNSGLPRAITQLMLYCVAYATDSDNDVGPEEPIEPLIYSFRDIMMEGVINPITDSSSKKDLDNYKNISQSFMDKLGKKFKENLFNKNSPFIQTTNIKACSYCRFNEICSR